MLLSMLYSCNDSEDFFFLSKYEDVNVQIKLEIKNRIKSKGWFIGKLIIKNKTNKTIKIKTEQFFLQNKELFYQMAIDSLASILVIKINPFEIYEDKIYFYLITNKEKNKTITKK